MTTITVEVRPELLAALDAASGMIESEVIGRSAGFRAEMLGHGVELDLLRVALLSATIREQRGRVQS